jgi:hypothetical protein
MDRAVKEEVDRLAEEFHIQWRICLYHFDPIDMLST